MSLHSASPPILPPQGYQWLKDKILSEDGRRQQAKLKELQAISERLGCTLPQLAIGTHTGTLLGSCQGSQISGGKELPRVLRPKPCLALWATVLTQRAPLAPLGRPDRSLLSHPIP